MRKQMAYILIFLGLISVVSGAFMLAGKKEPAILPSKKPAQTIGRDPVAPFNAQSVQISLTKNDLGKAVSKQREKATKNSFPVNTDNEESKLKGDAFEKFVVQNFDKNYFRITEWRGDKYVNGTYAESNHYPDLEIRFRSGTSQKLFAVECKWRKYLINDRLEWAKDYQVANYQKFAKKRKLPVFIIIGIGGTPDNPKHLYIIPLQKLNSPEIEQAELNQYLKGNKNFHWNEKENNLT